jgi:hypothetical protein
MMAPITAVIISIMNTRRHLHAMVMTVGTTECDRMFIVVMRGRCLFPIYCLVRNGNMYMCVCVCVYIYIYIYI